MKSNRKRREEIMRWIGFFLVQGILVSGVWGQSAVLVDRGTVAGDVVQLTIRSDQQVLYCKQVPYVKKKGDKITDPEKQRWVMRNLVCNGSLVGPEGKLLAEFSQIKGKAIEIEPALKASAWRVSSTDDADYAKAGGVQPTAVYRKSRPTDMVQSAAWKFEGPVEHRLYLKLPQTLQAGKRYKITTDALKLEPIEFVWQPKRMRSNAVHVNHLGFTPNSPAKVAFLSCWMGDGGGLSYKEGLEFTILENTSNKEVSRGKVRLAKAAADKTEDAYNRNYNGADVFEMEFTELKQPGVYRVYVEGVGCSYPFEIAEDIWERAFTVSARGFYHQRSGIALGPPYTEFKRPRSFHPDDGVKVYASTTALMDSGNGLNKQDSNFGNLNKGRTSELVENAWGGYMDAGDWDRRIQHLDVSRLLLDLALRFPKVYDTQFSLNIPESKNDLSDLVDEALFNLDCYRRMQTAAGGIRGGIESAEHPAHGEASWQESLTVMAYAPGEWSSYVYAGVAARAALYLHERKSKLAQIYRDSAERAMTWAEKELPKRQGKQPPEVNDARNLAAVELWRLTGKEKWHTLFQKTTVFKDPKAELFVWQKHEQREAAWLYAELPAGQVAKSLQENCRQAIIREADQRVEQCGKTGFRWTKFPWAPTAFTVLSSPDAGSLVRAHILTGQAKYLRAIVLACQTGLGANPVNMCYTTGLGHLWPRHALHIDSRITHQDPPPGLTVLGPIDTQHDFQKWAQDMVGLHLHPEYKQWPALEAYWDVFWFPVMCEFTVHQPMAMNAYVWGYLAARK
jgi:endoglucanase